MRTQSSSQPTSWTGSPTVGERIDRADLASMIEAARSALRLEQQPTYAADVETGAPARWLDGDTTPATETHPGIPAWLAHLDRLQSTGRTFERLRLVESPPTDYQRWAMWVAPIMVEAGEVIRYAHRTDVATPTAHDLWVFDRSTVVLVTFDQDGRATDYNKSTDHEQVGRVLDWWDATTAEVEPVKGPPWRIPLSLASLSNPAG